MSRLSAISIAAKPRTAIVINITVLAGICVRKPLQSRRRQKQEHRNCERVPRMTARQ
jgi:hypothetical protein